MQIPWLGVLEEVRMKCQLEWIVQMISSNDGGGVETSYFEVNEIENGEVATKVDSLAVKMPPHGR